MPEPTPPRGRLVLVRHGETEWSRIGRHTGTSDIPLTERGERLARRLPELLGGYSFVRVHSSPLLRASRTAELAGLRATTDPDLREWDYGAYEGLTHAEIMTRAGPDWRIFLDGVVPGATPGETLQDVAARARRALDRVEPDLHDGDVALVAHGHLLRILTTVYLRVATTFGEQLLLDAGAVCELRFDKLPSVQSWNRTVGE